MRRFVGWLLCCGLLGCETVGSATAPQPPMEFEATGGVSYFADGASFDEDRVLGPHVNLSRRTDGSWGGVMHGQAVSLNNYGEQFRGLNTLLSREKNGAQWVMGGQWQGEMFRFELGPTRLKVWMGKRSMTLSGDGKGYYGPDSRVRLTGKVLSEEPPFPQTLLTLIAAFGQENSGQPGGVAEGQGWGVQVKPGPSATDKGNE